MGWGLPSEGVKNPFIIATDINENNFKKIRFWGGLPFRRGIIVQPQKGIRQKNRQKSYILFVYSETKFF